MNDGPRAGIGRAIICLVAFLAALAQVAWRQSTTQEAMDELVRLEDRLIMLTDEEEGLRQRLVTLQGRRWVGEQAAFRLGLKRARAGDIIIIPGPRR